MRSLGRFSVMLGVLGTAISLASLAHAGIVVALVLDKQGAITPDVPAYHEIPSGTTITLSPGGKLVFMHYETCRTVAVSGGTIQFHERDYVVSSGGKLQSETGSPCPRKVRLKGGGEMAGTVMRGLTSSGALILSTRPGFVLVGESADDFMHVRVSQGAREVLQTPLNGPRFQWPANAPSLPADAEYEMLLVPKVLGVAKVKKTFRVKASATPSSSEELVLLHVD